MSPVSSRTQAALTAADLPVNLRRISPMAMPSFFHALAEAFTAAWVRSFDYTGRSKRSEYWYFFLANLLLSIVLLVLSAFSSVVGWVYSLWTVATVIPGLSLCVRRLRDAGKPWGWLFISLVPLVGAIWLIWLFIQPSV
jgi:uncharacterized membrane protein YhaH (DUF805 family)